MNNTILFKKIQKEKRTTLKRSFLSLFIHKNAVELFRPFLHFFFSHNFGLVQSILWFLLLLFTPIRAIHGKSKSKNHPLAAVQRPIYTFKFHGTRYCGDVSLLLPMTIRDHQESLPVFIDAVSVAVCIAGLK